MIYIIALIDDASRFITGIDVFYHDNFINLMSVMKSAIAKYGRPKVFNFDNGKSYKNRQMELLAARIGYNTQLLPAIHSHRKSQD
ncbi:integrase catalytic domain-containing protein [[Ruminococcus] torques]|uniref:integrase catalytic domain-containing protein n=1 Tax=[Ruminococcus] torques TaxID=33039 RepID=UPI003999EDE4